MPSGAHREHEPHGWLGLRTCLLRFACLLWRVRFGFPVASLVLASLCPLVPWHHAEPTPDALFAY